MADFRKLPPAVKLDVKPFTAKADEEKLQQLRQLIKLSPIAPQVWENSTGDRHYGMQRDWLVNAKKHWESDFDWRKQEDRINSFPNFITTVPDNDGNELQIHFVALFSQKADAIPLALFHGWPGSFLEFLPLLNILRHKYTPENLPYHIIVPSIVGYAYSSGPPINKNFRVSETADVMDRLLVGLGFGSGYLVQGGDIGSRICRYLAASSEACKGMHLNVVFLTDVNELKQKNLPIDDVEKEALPGMEAFQKRGFAYGLEHGTRPATIGLALGANPVALLSWIGEKFLEWTDDDPALDEILTSVSLYWLTGMAATLVMSNLPPADTKPETFPRCIYPYRGSLEIPGPLPYVSKPFGFSWFPKEIFPCPRSWAETAGDLLAYYQHTSGGHFAALEKPNELLTDIEDWISKAWKQ